MSIGFLSRVKRISANNARKLSARELESLAFRFPTETAFLAKATVEKKSDGSAIVRLRYFEGWPGLIGKAAIFRVSENSIFPLDKKARSRGTDFERLIGYVSGYAFPENFVLFG